MHWNLRALHLTFRAQHSMNGACAGLADGGRDAQGHPIDNLEGRIASVTVDIEVIADSYCCLAHDSAS